jgi:hypothetical protein
MFDEILEAIRAAVGQGKIILTKHGYSEMMDDDLFVTDLEQAILTGDIMTREWDEEFAEWKYTIHGDSQIEEEIAVVAKLDHEERVVIITTFRL